MKDSAYDILVKISEDLYSPYKEKKEKKQKEWENSPFSWFVFDLTSSQKGAVGEKMVAKFLTQQGFSVSKSPGSDSDLAVNGHQVEVKCSTLWEGGIYKFQQIRDQDYSILFCLGISPHEAHAWVARKADIDWNEISGQHTGEGAKDTSWTGFAPSQCPHTWMHPQTGDLTKVCGELRKIISS